jgi:phosphoenolpyruvate synthase/pyruvate phosphate dikinase
MNCRVKKGERKIIAIEEKEQFQTHTEIRIKPFFEIDALRRKKEAVKEFKRLVTKNYSYEK